MIQMCHCHGSSLRAILRRMATKRWRRTRSIGLPAAVAAAILVAASPVASKPALKCGTKDVPDLKFADTNCDGIDGVAKRAVFVAPTGSDAAPGTRARPLRSLQAAVALAARKRQSVYAMVGRYEVGSGLALADHVSIYGGYSARWKRSATQRVVIVGAPQAVLGTDVHFVVMQLVTLTEQLRQRLTGASMAYASFAPV